MSGHNREDEPSTSQGKRRRIDEREQPPNVMAEEAPNRIAIAAAPNEGIEEPRPQIFKLDVDCVQEMFDYLSIEDIHSVSETCTRMQRIAGDYFKTNFAAYEFEYRNGEIKRSFSDSFNLNGFKDFIQKLKIDKSASDEEYRFIGQHLKSLKQMTFDSFSLLNAIKIEHLKPILTKIESVNFNNFDYEFYEHFLQFCPTLKRLRIYVNKKPIIGTDNEWLSRTYPTLENLELVKFRHSEIPRLRVFFKRNPSLQKLFISTKGFLKNINEMKKAKLKLQVLHLYMCPYEEAVFEHLDQLYRQGIYQKLHLFGFLDVQQTIDRISSLHGLEMFNLLVSLESPTTWNLNSLVNLNYLGLHVFRDNDAFPIDSQSTAKSLPNLQRLYLRPLYDIKCEHIEPFIEYSAKLKAIKIHGLIEDKCIDLPSLNEKRAKLFEARKVTIYLEEDAYLKTKWGNKTTDFDMIELKRAESINW